MIFKKYEHKELTPFEPYLFQIIDTTGDTYYTVGHVDSYGGIILDKYQHMAEMVTGYAEIEE